MVAEETTPCWPCKCYFGMLECEENQCDDLCVDPEVNTYKCCGDSPQICPHGELMLTQLQLEFNGNFNQIFPYHHSKK